MIVNIGNLLAGNRHKLINAGFITYSENWTINHAVSTAKQQGRKLTIARLVVLSLYFKCVYRIVFNAPISAYKLKAKLDKDIADLYSLSPVLAKKLTDENKFFTT
jgi:hypothetical protein